MSGETDNMIMCEEKKEASGKRATAIILLVLSIIFWGLSFISTKILLKEIPPASIAFFRQIIAFLVLAVWLISTRKLPKITVKDFLKISFASVFGIVLYFIFENTGLQYTGASNASMIVSAVPVFTLITEMLFFKHKASWKIFLSILISILGVYLVISINGKLDFSSKSFFGNILVLLSMISWVVYTIIIKIFSSKHSSTTLTTYQTFASIFIFLPFVIPEASQWKILSFVSMANLLYLGVFCSAFAYIFFIYATKRLGPTISSSFLNLIPVVTVLAGFFLLDERISILQIAGMLLILVSLYFLSKKPRQRS